jgi:hypothetical protein
LPLSRKSRKPTLTYQQSVGADDAKLRLMNPLQLH